MLVTLHPTPLLNLISLHRVLQLIALHRFQNYVLHESLVLLLQQPQLLPILIILKLHNLHLPLPLPLPSSSQLLNLLLLHLPNHQSLLLNSSRPPSPTQLSPDILPPPLVMLLHSILSPNSHIFLQNQASMVLRIPHLFLLSYQPAQIMSVSLNNLKTIL